MPAKTKRRPARRATSYPPRSASSRGKSPKRGNRRSPAATRGRLVWLGFGLLGRVVVVFLAAFFPILINTYTGVRDAPSDLVEVATAFGVSSEFGMLRRVVVPAATPFVLAGIRLGIGRGIVGMAIAEVYLRLGGIGALISSYGAVFRTDFLLAAILPLPLLGIGLTKLFGYVEKRVRYWRVSAAA